MFSLIRQSYDSITVNDLDNSAIPKIGHRQQTIYNKWCDDSKSVATDHNGVKRTSRFTSRFFTLSYIKILMELYNTTIILLMSYNFIK